MNKKTLLITGTSGFIGFHFLEHALSKNYYVIDILKKKKKNITKIKKLKKKYSNRYKTIFFSDYKQLEKKLKKIKIDCFIHFATLYKSHHNHKDIFELIDSNVLFPTLIYDLILQKTKKFINFGTMMQHTDGKTFKPNNLYAATKNAFEMITSFYSTKKDGGNFYNIKLYESFGELDKRKKLIPTIIRNYKKKTTTKIYSKNLELNIIHIDDIIKAIEILLKKNIKPGSYCLKQKKNIKVIKLIEYLNENLKNKIKVKYDNKSVTKINKSKIKILPGWKPEIPIIEKIKENFDNETN